MNPRHNNPKNRIAHAPYNFVPLPEKVVTVDITNIPRQDEYTGNNGYIKCTLTVETPLYIRSAMTKDFFSRFGDYEFSQLSEEQKKERAQFYHRPDRPDEPVIPGSSLRGMVRSLVEIAAYGKMQWLTKDQVTFRAVATSPKKDSLAAEYRKVMGNYSSNVKAGYLFKKNDSWYIQPAKTPSDYGWRERKPYLEVKDKDISQKDLPEFISLGDTQKYKPQYHKVTFNVKIVKEKPRVFNLGTAKPDSKYCGILVCSGNMAETGGEKTSPRTTHVIILEQDSKKKPLKINKSVITDYLSTLTPFQKQAPFDDKYGCLKDERPVFYVTKDDAVYFFGHSPNFRIPAIPNHLDRAASPYDYTPEYLHREEDIDLAEAIFGYTDSVDQCTRKNKRESRAGRVFFTDACVVPAISNPWLDSKPIITPIVLSSPKPTAFQHYLTQQTPDNPGKLNHYASPSTVIRGHKLYWHKKNVQTDSIMENGEKIKQNPKQYTLIKPVRPGVNFSFCIYFENMKDEELGALLWVLSLPGDKYRHRLGMGKPLSMGSVKINPVLHLMDRKSRYKKLIQNGKWFEGETIVKNNDSFIKAFECHIFENIHADDKDKAECFVDTERISTLLKMLEWSGKPSETTRYMDIEAFKERKVLPKPLEVK